jgi:predicted permease
MPGAWPSRLWMKLAALLKRRRLDRDLDEELQFHLAMREEKLRAEGLAPADARFAARRRFGNAARIKETSRELWTFASIETFWQDLRYGARMLAKNPGFTAIALLTLALGIGANTAIFSFINGTLLRSFSYADSSRLVLLWSANPERGWMQNIVSPADFADWRAQSRSFESLAAFEDWGADLTSTGPSGTAGVPVLVQGLRVTANLYSLLGVQPALGRDFLPQEGRPGANHVVVLSHSLWVERYNRDPVIIGKTIRMNGESFSVIGVMPASFEFPPVDSALAETSASGENKVQLWVPLPFVAAGAVRGVHEFTVIGRLKPGVTLAAAQSEMTLIADRIQKEHPDSDTGWTVQAETLRHALTGDLEPILLVLMAAVFFVLLIACANVANLQLSRAVSRRREIAIRSALGAGRRRLIRQFLAESGVLAVAGGALGVALAWAAVRLVLALYFPGDSSFEAVRIDHRVLLFTLAVSLATAFVFGLVPALLVSRVDLNETLKEGGRGSSEGSGTHRFRGVLTTAEFALALVLLVGAGLLIRTFLALTQVNPGFDAKGVLAFALPFSGPHYQEQGFRAAFYDRLLPRLRALPGVEGASVVTSTPLVGMNGWGFVTEQNPSPPSGREPDASYQVIAPDYFQVMRIAVLAGRVFNGSDQQGSPPVAIISRALARTYWPGQNPVGKHLKIGDPDSHNPWRTVVGVVGDVHRAGLARAFYPELYVPYTQYPWQNNPLMIVVRTAGDPVALTASIRSVVAGIDPDLPVSGVTTMQTVVENSISGNSFNMALLAALAGLALVLAAVGIYGSMSYAVSQRTHEFGVRMALGAGRRELLALVLRHGLVVSLTGVGIGLAGALLLMRLLANLLFGVSATDPLTFAAVALLLTLVALFACCLPARRAARVDPTVALRHE